MTTHMIRNTILTLTIIASGCAGYRIGTSLPDNIKTISVPTFRNETNEPDLDRTVTSETIREIQRDRTLSIVSEESGDIILTASIVSAKMTPVRYETNAARVVDEYRLTLRAKIVVTRGEDGSKIFSEVVEGYSTFVASGDLATSKRTAIPDAATDLAKNITTRIVEMW